MKKVGIALVVFIAVVAGALYWLRNNLDSLVRDAIAKYGSEMTQAKVSVGSVKIDAVNGEGIISDFEIGNPHTSGEQRDAAAALDAAHDRGDLSRAREAWSRFQQLPADYRDTALWIVERAEAVRLGAIVSAAEWAEIYGRLAGPERHRLGVVKERRDLALVRLKRAQVAAQRGVTAELAKEIDDARSAAEGAAVAYNACVARSTGWARVRLEALLRAWREA